MKRILTFFIAVSLVCSSAAAADDDGAIAAAYEANTGAVTLSGTMGSEKGTPITVVITDNDNEISDSNQPVAAYVVYTADSGLINDRHTFDGVLPSGMVKILLTSEYGTAQSEILVFSESDAGTKAVLDNINSAASAAELEQYLGQNNNIEKLGFLYDETKDYLGNISSFLVAARSEKGKNLSLDEVVSNIHCSLFFGKVGSGSLSVDEGIRRHAVGLNCEYADYSALTDKIKTELADLIDTADYAAKKKQITLNELVSVSKARIAAESWSSLKDLLTENADEYNIDISSGSNYAKVSATNKQNVFYNMLSGVKNSAYISDISSLFESESAAEVTRQSQSSTSGGGSGGGSKKNTSGGVISFQPNDTVNNDENKTEFSDIKNHFAEDAVKTLVAKGIVNGYPNGSFAPDAQVTRAEFAAMTAKLLNVGSAGAANGFADVSTSDWYCTAVNSLASMGIITGYNSDFRPNDNITRQDAAVILNRVLTLKGVAAENGSTFADETAVSDYALQSVSNLCAKGVIQGYNGYFRPLDEVTRGEAAVMIYRILD